MTRQSIRKAAAIAAAVACMTTVGSARAADDDEQGCDDLMAELKTLSEGLMKANPKGTGPLCAASGQLLGAFKATREVASECYNEGVKRDQILIALDKAVAEIESQIGGACK